MELKHLGLVETWWIFNQQIILFFSVWHDLPLSLALRFHKEGEEREKEGKTVKERAVEGNE